MAPVPHGVSHAPQCRGSSVVSVHTGAPIASTHISRGAKQLVTHVPDAQTSVAPHGWSHIPQWSELPVTSTHAVPHILRGAAHVPPSDGGGASDPVSMSVPPPPSGGGGPPERLIEQATQARQAKRQSERRRRRSCTPPWYCERRALRDWAARRAQPVVEPAGKQTSPAVSHAVAAPAHASYAASCDAHDVAHAGDAGSAHASMQHMSASHCV
jgi:hypothetical protein